MTPRAPTCRARTALLALAVAAASAGCGPTLHVQAPSDFGRYAHGRDGRWITPEGVVLRARSVANEPVATVAFWTEAATRHLERRGYKVHNKRCFRSASGLDGCRVDLLLPRGSEDWLYAIALYIHHDRVLIVEAAGPFAQLQALDGALHTAFATFDPDRQQP